MRTLDMVVMPGPQNGRFDVEVVVGGDGGLYRSHISPDGQHVLIERWEDATWQPRAQLNLSDLGDPEDLPWVSLRDVDIAVSGSGEIAVAALGVLPNMVDAVGVARLVDDNWMYEYVTNVSGLPVTDRTIEMALAYAPDGGLTLATVLDWTAASYAYAHVARMQIVEYPTSVEWNSSWAVSEPGLSIRDPNVLHDAAGSPIVTFHQGSYSPLHTGLVALVPDSQGHFNESHPVTMVLPQQHQGVTYHVEDVIVAQNGVLVASGTAIDQAYFQSLFSATYDLQSGTLDLATIAVPQDYAERSIVAAYYQPELETTYHLMIVSSFGVPPKLTVTYVGADGAWKTGNSFTLPAGVSAPSFQFSVDAMNQATVIVESADTGALAYAMRPAYDIPNGTGHVVITGAPLLGQTLTADISGLADADGIDVDTITYLWWANGFPVDGATSSTLLVNEDFLGQMVLVEVRYRDLSGVLEIARSEVTDEVRPQAHAPVVSGVPSAAVAVTVGATVKLPALTVSDDDGDNVLLTVTVAAVNGVLSGLEGVASETGVFTYQGTAQAVNAWLAAGAFKASAAGSASVQITVSDGVEIEPVTVSYTASTATTPPVGPGVVTPVVTPGTSPDGTPTHTIAIPVVQPGRPGAEPAKVSLVSDGGTALLQAQVPAGFGLTVSGPSGTTSGAQSLAELIREIKAHTEAGSGDQNVLMGGGTSFVSGLDASSPLLVQTIAPTAAPTSGNERLVINSTATTDGGVLTALVVDATGLSAPLKFEGSGVEFFALIGHIDLLAGADAQSVWGDSGEQTVRLGTGQATVMTGGGNDTIVGSFGGGAADSASARVASMAETTAAASLFHGGADEDVVRYDLASDEVVITRDFAITTVRSLSDPDAVHVLINVESIAFSDKTVEIEADTSLGWIAGLYDQVLGRQAEVDGIQYWAHQHAAGMSAGEIALQFLYSAEADLVLDTDTADARGITVEAFYEGLLGRASDAVGKAYWVKELADGGSVADMAGAFLATAEGKGTALDQTEWNFFV